jgi:hypothetical protein
MAQDLALRPVTNDVTAGVLSKFKQALRQGAEAVSVNSMLKAFRASGGTLPTGYGAEGGRVVGFVEEVPITSLWLNENLQVLCDGEEDYLPSRRNVDDPEQNALYESVVATLENQAIYNDLGAVVQTLIQPLIVFKRTNPSNEGQTLMSVSNARVFAGVVELAVRRKWRTIPVIVKNDMVDGDIREFGMQLAMSRTAPNRSEILRQAYLLRYDAERGCYTGDASTVTQLLSELGLGKESRTLAEKVEATIEAFGTDPDSYKVSMRTLIDLSVPLRKHPAKAKELLSKVIAGEITAAQAARDALEYKYQQLGQPMPSKKKSSTVVEASVPQFSSLTEAFRYIVNTIKSGDEVMDAGVDITDEVLSKLRWSASKVGVKV